MEDPEVHHDSSFHLRETQANVSFAGKGRMILITFLTFPIYGQNIHRLQNR